jgi:hypothetical protein
VNEREPATDAAAFLETVAGIASRAIASRRSAEKPSPAPSKAAADRGAAVLRVLRGEVPSIVAHELGIAEAELEAWKRAFLEGALKNLE